MKKITIKPIGCLAMLMWLSLGCFGWYHVFTDKNLNPSLPLTSIWLILSFTYEYINKTEK